MRTLGIILLALVFAIGCKKSEDKKEPTETNTVKPEMKPETKPETMPEAKPDLAGYNLMAPGDLKWMPLDPKDPDGVTVAPVWGNPMTGPSALHLRIPAKGNAGLHTHTASYQAVVLSGNAKHWLPGEKESKLKPLSPGSFWFQPGGQAHGDSCDGPEACDLFIVMDGKFDFAPATDVKKVEKGDYKMVRAEDAKFAPMDPNAKGGPMVTMLKGDPAKGPVSFQVKFEKGMTTGLHSHTSDYHAVLVRDGHSHWVDGQDGEKDVLKAGTYWFQPGGQVHGDTCNGDDGCLAYVFMPKALDFLPKAAE